MRVSDTLPNVGLVVALVQCGGELRAKPEEAERLLRPMGLEPGVPEAVPRLPELLPAPAVCA